MTSFLDAIATHGTRDKSYKHGLPEIQKRNIPIGCGLPLDYHHQKQE